MLHLGVNIDHVATVRNARGTEAVFIDYGASLTSLVVSGPFS